MNLNNLDGKQKIALMVLAGIIVIILGYFIFFLYNFFTQVKEQKVEMVATPNYSGEILGNDTKTQAEIDAAMKYSEATGDPYIYVDKSLPYLIKLKAILNSNKLDENEIKKNIESLKPLVEDMIKNSRHQLEEDQFVFFRGVFSDIESAISKKDEQGIKAGIQNLLILDKMSYDNFVNKTK